MKFYTASASCPVSAHKNSKIRKRISRLRQRPIFIWTTCTKTSPIETAAVSGFTTPMEDDGEIGVEEETARQLSTVMEDSNVQQHWNNRRQRASMPSTGWLMPDGDLLGQN